MTRRILVVPAHPGAGLTSVCLGLTHALQRSGADVGYVKPLAQTRLSGEPDHSTELIRLATTLRPPEPIGAERLHEALAGGDLDALMRRVVDASSEMLGLHDIVLFEGLAPSERQILSDRVNASLALALDADVIIVGSAASAEPELFADQVAATVASYPARALGVVVNKLPTPVGDTVAVDTPTCEPFDIADAHDLMREWYRDALAARGLRLIGSVGVHEELACPRLGDVARGLGCDVVTAGDAGRRVRAVAIAAQSVPGFLSSLQPGCLILVPGDRHEVLLSAALAEMNGTALAGVVLTAGVAPHPDVLALCEPAFSAGLPVLLSAHKTFETAAAVLALDPSIPEDDEERALLVREVMADGFDAGWIDSLPRQHRPHHVTPPEFYLRTHHAVGRDRYAIALPDPTPAAIAAAAAHVERDEVRCVLVTTPERVREAAAGLILPPELDLVEPEGDALRTALRMLATGEVDGVVGGDLAELTALALEVVGLRSDDETVCAMHLLMRPDAVVAYADAALATGPSARDLASIAMQTANALELARITPRVAFVGHGRFASSNDGDERVFEAVDLLRERRPDLSAWGPVAFESAGVAPPWEPAGEASALVFPDQRTAAATLDAVRGGTQSGVVGPVLLGFARPVNAVPPDASAADIDELIVLTALQAGQSV